MTRLTIEICADDDHEALRVLGRLTRMMEVRSIYDGECHLNDAGYTVGALDGNGTAKVEHFESKPEKVTP